MVTLPLLPPRNLRSELNVGGEFYTTTLGTLRKFPGSKLAEMFSPAPPRPAWMPRTLLHRRCGTYFGPRPGISAQGSCPPSTSRRRHRGEAQHYEIKTLIKHSEDTPQIFGEQVSAEAVLAAGARLQREPELMALWRGPRPWRRAFPSPGCSLVRNEKEDANCADALRSLELTKGQWSNLGLWKAALDISDLLDCLNMTLRPEGTRYAIHTTVRSYQPRSPTTSTRSASAGGDPQGPGPLCYGLW